MDTPTEPNWAELALRWDVPPETPPDQWAEAAETALRERWQAVLLARLDAEPNAETDTADPLLARWRETQATLTALRQDAETTAQALQDLRARTMDRELRRSLESLPLDAPAAEVLPLIRPLLESRYVLDLDTEGALLLADRAQPDAPQPADAVLAEALTPLRLLRRSQANAAPNSPAPDDVAARSAWPVPAGLRLARAHLDSLRSA